MTSLGISIGVLRSGDGLIDLEGVGKVERLEHGDLLGQLFKAMIA